MKLVPFVARSQEYELDGCLPPLPPLAEGWMLVTGAGRPFAFVPRGSPMIEDHEPRQN